MFDPTASLIASAPRVRVSSAALMSQLLSLCFSVLLLGCQPTDQATAPAANPANLPPAKVKVAKPLAQEVSEWDEFTGRIEAVNSVQIRSRVSGYLEKVAFTAGKKVKKGDLLFQIDPKPFQAQLDLANAELEQAKTKLALAQNDLARAKNLLKANAIAVEEFDGRNKAVRESAAAVQAGEARVAAAKLNLDYTQIYAPIDGRVAREMLTAGNLVNGGGDATVLTTIVSIDPVYVYVNADERSVLKYKRQHAKGLIGKPVELNVVDESNFPHKGTLDYSAPRADPETGTLSLRAVFNNQDEFLSPGFFARVRLRASAPYSALLIPERAINTDQAQRFVWLLKPDNQVEYRKVELGTLQGKLRVISAGLTAEDTVIIDGLQKIRPGSKVQPEQTTVGEE